MAIPLLTALFTVLADQASKYLAGKSLQYSDTLPVINGIFHLTLTHNRGAAFSIFQGGSAFFVFISIVCIIFILISLLRPNVLKYILGVDLITTAVKISLGLILGGATGNLIDRIRFGYVIDFLDFRVWPVFNLADSAITVGAVIICWKMFFCTKKMHNNSA